MKTVERGITLSRIFNLREGFSDKDDTLPKRFFTTSSIGPLKDKKIESEEHYSAKKAYYQMLGWDEKGIPSNGRIAELGIEWASKYICQENSQRKRL
jgi:aldehyde:ferredoxin oxidoreductase